MIQRSSKLVSRGNEYLLREYFIIILGNDLCNLIFNYLSFVQSSTDKTLLYS